MLLLTILGLAASAKDYYISNSGSDSNSGTDPSSPWQTIDKVNSFRNFSSGDNILFKRGDTFYGSIIIFKSGSPGSPITYGAYGSGVKPVVTGFTDVTSWNNLGGNIWESTDAVSDLSSCNMLSINGANIPMGRYPNTGWLKIDSHVGTTSLASSSLNSATTDWTGAEVVTRTLRWGIDRGRISGHSGSKLTYTKSGSYEPADGWGFFIQNDAKTLDEQNEWYYNPVTKKISVYSLSTPANVRVASVDILIDLKTNTNITFNDLKFIGGNLYGAKMTGGNNITFQYCDFDFMGIDAINSYPGTNYTLIEYCTFNHSGCSAVSITASHYSAIRYNTVKNAGLHPGMGGNSLNLSYGLSNVGNKNVIEYNTVDSIGYNGIQFDGDGSRVEHNFVNHYCQTIDDGGGIYTFPQQGVRTYVQKIIANNIVLNGGNPYQGTDDKDNQTAGIYLDGQSSYYDITGNTVSGGARWGVFFNNSSYVNVRENTIYDVSTSLFFRKYNTTASMTDIDVKKNVLVGKANNSVLINWYFESGNKISLPSTFTSDSNYVTRPLNDSIANNLIFSQTNGYSLSDWKSTYDRDLWSNISPKQAGNSDLRFEYNATTSITTVNLDAQYIDVKGKDYDGSITLAPYTSVVLIKNGELRPNKAPTANAGSDKTITLPANTVSLSGSGADEDGTIATYSWTKIAGPSAFSIRNTSSATSQVSGLVEGTYQFELKVTDNKNATGKDTVQITVNAAQTNTIVKPNTAPVAKAGNDTTVVAPVDFITLTGSGTDEDGQISTYFWKQVSGPLGSVISQNNNVTATVSNLTEGTYEFELSVKDNEGAVSKDTLKITVALGRFARESHVVKVYPNPVHDIATVDISTGKSNTNLMIVIADISGKVVYKKNFVSPIMNVKSEVNMSNLIKGTYIVTVYFDGMAKQSVKVVKL
jgi:hypothetical protein